MTLTFPPTMPEDAQAQWLAKYQDLLDDPERVISLSWKGKDYCPRCGDDITDATDLWKCFHLLGCKAKGMQ
jgi:hypothetical protein